MKMTIPQESDKNKAEHSHSHEHHKIPEPKIHDKKVHEKVMHDHGGDSSEEIPMGKAGHDHHRMMVKDFRKRFWVSLIVTVPILVFSPMIQHFFNYQLILPGNKYILFILSSFVYFWGAWPFLTGFITELRKKDLV